MTEILPRPRSGRLPRGARKAQLLEVALEVFVESGYHAASMDEIAVRAGVSKPVLYQHFPGKLDLYLALLETSADSVLAGVRDALASTTDNRERVGATMGLWYDYAANRHPSYRLVFESDLTAEPLVRQQIDRVVHGAATAICEVIVEDTHLDPAAAQLLAVSLVGLGHLGAGYWLDTESTLTRDEAVRLAGRLAWRGIGGFPKPSDTQPEGER